MEDLVQRILGWREQQGDDLIAVYGFGSSFGGSHRADSDVDLAVLFTGPLSPQRRWALQEEIADLLKKDVDLVDMRGTNLVLLFQIMSEGKRLFCGNDTVCNVFETYVFSAYDRFNVERRDILKDVLSRKSVYGG